MISFLSLGTPQPEHVPPATFPASSLSLKTPPASQISLRIVQSILKMLTPFVLEYLYEQFETQKAKSYYSALFAAVIWIGLCSCLEISNSVDLEHYKLNVRKELSTRIIRNNILSHRDGSVDLLSKMFTKLPIFINNYYSSILGLVSDVFSVVFIIVLLYFRLSDALFVGLILAVAIMWRVRSVTRKMQTISLRNYELKARKIKLLNQFLNRVEEMKMCWLDSWIDRKLQIIQDAISLNYRNIKILDCWCVALWGFTSVCLTAIVIIAYYFFDLQTQLVVRPATLISSFQLLTTPLNAISWYIAGMKNSNQAILELEEDVRVISKSDSPSVGFNQSGRLLMASSIEVKCGDGNAVTVPKGTTFLSGNIYSLGSHPYAESILQQLSKNIEKIGYVEENGWMMETFLQTVTVSFAQPTSAQVRWIKVLMDLFCGETIPLDHSPTSYSGGEKLRVSLVRAFLLEDIVVINSSLLSLNAEMKAKVQRGIYCLAHGLVPDIQDRVYNVIMKDSSHIASHQLNIHSCSCSFIPVLLPASIITEKINQSKLNLPFSFQQKQESVLDELRSIGNRKCESPAFVNLKTYRFYYNSPKHIIFLVSIVAVTFMTHYYNSYLITHVRLDVYDPATISFLCFMTILFALALFFRSYYFAAANLEDSSQIVQIMNKRIIFEQLPYLQGQAKEKLIHLLVDDSETLIDGYPFDANILANNIMMILSAILIILLQMPVLGLFVMPLLYYTYFQNLQLKTINEDLSAHLNAHDVRLIEIISILETGRKYLLFHKKTEEFISRFEGLLRDYLAIDWLKIRFRSHVNLKYKLSMTVFLLAGLILYSLSGTENASGLTLLVQYTLALSSYLFYITESMWNLNHHATSIERVRLFFERQPPSNRAQAHQIRRAISQESQDSCFVNISNLSFKYPGGQSVLTGLSLCVKRGDKIVIRGKSGAGKTTLFKLLTSVYPQSMDLSRNGLIVSFSPQHALILPETDTILDNIDPYGLFPEAVELFSKFHPQISLLSDLNMLSIEHKISLNNFRAYLYGRNGLIVYDEPERVYSMGQHETHIIVAHHKQYPSHRTYELCEGKLSQI